MSESIGVAIVGCGWAGRRHAEAFIKEGARLRWAIDTDQHRAAAVARLQEGARFSPHLQDALQSQDVQAIDVCLPHYLHFDACIAAIRAGKDVLCEKPLAITLEQADRMIEAAEQAEALLMVAENECFDPLCARMKGLLDEGTIGEPALVQATRECNLRDSFLHERPWFLDQRQAGGGILLSGAVHDFAKLRVLLGEITEVYALRARQRFHELDADDTAVLALRFQSGTIGTLVESFFMLDPVTAGGQEVHRLRIDGDGGSMEVLGSDRVRVTTAEGAHEVRVRSEDTFVLEVRHFLDCVDSRTEPLTSARRQRPNLALVAAAYASIEAGGPIRLPGS